MRIITRSALFAAALLAWVPAHADEASVNSAIDALLGDHVQYQAAIEAIIEAANSGDAETFASYFSYPITVPVDGEPQTIETANDFVANYDAIMTDAITGTLTGQDYGELFVNADGIMFGAGEVWINGICIDNACSTFDVRVVTLQEIPD
jgi:hypothetical protein